MQKQLMLVLGALLGSCLPVCGQTLSAALDFTQRRPAPRATLLAASSRDLPLTSVTPKRSVAESPARLPAVAQYRSPNWKPPAKVRVELIQTPFIRQGRIPLAQLWGGRLRLDGFAGEVVMKNVLDGPLRRGYSGTIQPRAAAAFGMSLSFRLGRDASL